MDAHVNRHVKVKADVVKNEALNFAYDWSMKYNKKSKIIWNLSYLLDSRSEAAVRSSRAARCFPKAFRQVARRMRDFTCEGSMLSALVQSDWVEHIASRFNEGREDIDSSACSAGSE